MTTKYPSDWQNKRLSDCCSRVTRKNKAGISLVLTASGEYGLVDQKEFFNKQVAPKNLSGYYHLRKGEFAYNRSSMKGYPYGAIKRLARYDDGALSTLYLCFSVSSSDVDPCFMEHLFESSQLDLELQPIARVGARAHGLLNVTPSEFMDIQLCLPPLPEQKKIAAILSSVDETIQATRETIEQTKKVKQGLMQELLTKGIGHTRFKKTEIGEIPEGWDLLPLDKLSFKISDGTHHSPKTQSQGFLYITSKNVKPFKLDISAPLYISAQDHASIHSRCDVKQGDILYTKDGANTGYAVVNPLADEFSLLSSVAIIRTDFSKLLNTFLCQYLNSPIGFSLARGDMDGLAIKRLTLTKIKKMHVPVPPIREQTEIVSILSSVDNQIQLEEAILQQQELLKKGLMQDLLTGKVRVAV